MNLRSGPGINFPPVTILKNGDEVNVENQEGIWYSVSLPDGLRGYIYAELIRLIPEQTELQPTEAAPPTSMPTPTIEISLEGSTPKSPPEIPSPQPIVDQQEKVLSPIIEARIEVPVETPSPSQPVINSPSPNTQAAVPGKIETTLAHKANQRRLWKILSWILAPSCIFILGWILGGNYYLRRDRIERTKLRF